MKCYSKVILAVVLFAVASSYGIAQAPKTAAKAATGAKSGPIAHSGLSDQVFKNVQSLKGIPLDDFMGAMGIMTASLGYDCSECHVGAGTTSVDWVTDTPLKLTTRRMINMVKTINTANFGGRQLVTCWSCHRGRDRPLTTPALENVYGPVHYDMDDVITQDAGEPPAATIIDKYINAIGGADKVSKLKSYIATGKSVDFGGFGKGGVVHIYGEFPNKRATIMNFPAEPQRGDSVRAFDGKEAWLRTPLTIISEFQLTGNELDGATIDAELAFPAQIKTFLGNLRVGLPMTISDLSGPASQTKEEGASGLMGSHAERLVNVVQGNGPRGSLATMYFDQKTGLLLRVVRQGKTPIGRFPTQIDYSDYRDVGGIKLPFHILFSWPDGRDDLQFSEIKTNVPVDAAKFGRPAPLPVATLAPAR